MKFTRIAVAALALSAGLLVSCSVKDAKPVAKMAAPAFAEAISVDALTLADGEAGGTTSTTVDFAKLDASDLALLAVSGSEADRKGAAERLRSMGPAGLAELERFWAIDVARLREVGSFEAEEAARVREAIVEHRDGNANEETEISVTAKADPKGHRTRIEEAFVRVTGQHDGLYSGLFWHTDHENARLAARESGKPILSLRVLGRLDDAMC